MKLANKKAIEGDMDYALRLAAAAEPKTTKVAKTSPQPKSEYEQLLSKYAGIEDLKKWREEHGKGKAKKDDMDEEKDDMKSEKKPKHKNDEKEEDKPKSKKDQKSSKGSYKSAIKEMNGFIGMDGDDFCFEEKSQAREALKVAEQAANFVNWKVEKGDDCFKLCSHGLDKESSTLSMMKRKYAGK
jgi:hypothetical protein